MNNVRVRNQVSVFSSSNFILKTKSLVKKFRHKITVRLDSIEILNLCFERGEVKNKMSVVAIVACLIIIIILLKIFDNVKNKRTYELLRQFPSLPTYPIIGNLYMLCGSLNGVLKKADKVMEHHDRLVFWLFSIPGVILKKHDDIVTILTQSQDRETLGLSNEWIGFGLLNATYHEWKKSRKVLAPAFSSEMLAKYTIIFNERSSALVNVFKQVADTGQVIDVWDDLIKNNVHAVVGVLKKLDRIFGTHDRSVFWMFSIPVVILKKHEDIMMILTQSQDRETLGLATEWIGTGLINAKYEDWKKSRKVLTPAFSSDMLSKYIEVFNERSLALVKVFKREADTGQVINVWDHLIKINVDTIVENVMGISITTCGEKGDKFGHAVYETFQNMIKRFIAPWLHPRLIYLAYLKITGKSNIIKDLHYLPTKILREKMAEYRRGSVQLGKNLEDFNNYFSKTVIHQLIREGIKEPSFDETRMRDELLHITGAAIETTALNVAFLMLMLAINQDIQQKVYEEITELLSDDDMLTPNHLFNHLKYLEQCLKETSRMFTSVIGTIRRTHKDCVLKDNVIIPANTLVFSAIHWAHYDKEAFKNPYKWDPEHFNEQAEQNRSKSGLLSFGYGPRSCIGAKYAMLSMKTQMAYILRNFHLSTNIKEFTYDDLYADVSIRSKIGYPIRFTSRTKLKQ